MNSSRKVLFTGLTVLIGTLAAGEADTARSGDPAGGYLVGQKPCAWRQVRVCALFESYDSLSG